MIKKEVINGKLFLIQSTFYIYDSEDGNVKEEIPLLVTSDKNLFYTYKKSHKKQHKI